MFLWQSWKCSTLPEPSINPTISTTFVKSLTPTDGNVTHQPLTGHDPHYDSYRLARFSRLSIEDELLNRSKKLPPGYSVKNPPSGIRSNMSGNEDVDDVLSMRFRRPDTGVGYKKAYERTRRLPKTPVQMLPKRVNLEFHEDSTRYNNHRSRYSQEEEEIEDYAHSLYDFKSANERLSNNHSSSRTTLLSVPQGPRSASQSRYLRSKAMIQQSLNFSRSCEDEYESEEQPPYLGHHISSSVPSVNRVGSSEIVSRNTSVRSLVPDIRFIGTNSIGESDLPNRIYEKRPSIDKYLADSKRRDSIYHMDSASKSRFSKADTHKNGPYESCPSSNYNLSANQRNESSYDNVIRENSHIKSFKVVAASSSTGVNRTGISSQSANGKHSSKSDGYLNIHTKSPLPEANVVEALDQVIDLGSSKRNPLMSNNRDPSVNHLLVEKDETDRERYVTAEESSTSESKPMKRRDFMLGIMRLVFPRDRKEKLLPSPYSAPEVYFFCKCYLYLCCCMY